MADPNVLWLAGAIFAVAIGLLAGAAALARQRGMGQAASAEAGDDPAAPPAGPIVLLDFAESLDPARFADAAEQAAVEYANHHRLHLRDRLADSANITLQTLRQLLGQLEMIVEASPRASRAIATGTASVQRRVSRGRRLPHVIDVKSGQVQEVMKEVRFTRKALAGAAATSTVVVSLAHVISAADLARKLDLVDQKLDLLLAYRRIDQQAALERIYGSARELLAMPFDEMRRIELWRLRHELRELRVIWRREFEHHLGQIEKLEEKGLIEWLFTPQAKYDEGVRAKISKGELQLAMIEYSLRIDLMLAEASGTWENAMVTLAGELDAIDRVGSLLSEKAAFISDERRQDSARKMIDYANAIVGQYRALLGRAADPQGVVNIVNTPAVSLPSGP